MNNCFLNPSLSISILPQSRSTHGHALMWVNPPSSLVWAPCYDNSGVPYLYVELHVFQNILFDPHKICCAFSLKKGLHLLGAYPSTPYCFR